MEKKELSEEEFDNVSGGTGLQQIYDQLQQDLTAQQQREGMQRINDIKGMQGMLKSLSESLNAARQAGNMDLVASLVQKMDSLSASVQNEMIHVQDAISQYNSWTKKK